MERREGIRTDYISIQFILLLLVADTYAVSVSSDHALRGNHHRSLLAPAGCAASSQYLLNNGYFDPTDASDMHNMLVAATMANDAYPWARQFGFSIIDVVQGLTAAQTLQYQQMFTEKYQRLGASSVKFIDYYSPNGDIAAHVIVVGTPRSVFVAYRGTADVGQGWTSADISAIPHVVFGQTLEMYKAPYLSTMGSWAEVLDAVKQAVAATDNPAAARIYTTGHSLGGASACLSALLFKELGFNIGGVYAYGPYKIGTTCAEGEECWVTVYDKHLADVTWVWWNNQDPIPALLDNALGTTFANSKWGHVPQDKGWIRVVGDQCMRASGTRLTDICPPEVDAADGAADGVCSKTLVDAHLPWVYLQKVARCTLLQNPRDGGSNRMDMCGRSAVWENLLGLPVPAGRSDAAAVSRLIELAATTQTEIDVLSGLRPTAGRRSGRRLRS